MYKKKLSVLALTSLMTLSLPLIAEEATMDDAAVADSAGVTAEASEDETTPDTAAMGDEAMAAAQERWQERNARYEELKARAKEAGVMLPQDPPWKSAGTGMMPDMAERMQQHQAMMAMTREERYKAMQERAKERGMEMPDTPPWEARQSAMDDEWAKQQAVIDSMSDEERAACHAMHRRHMGMMRGMPERPMMRGAGMGPGMMGPGMMAPGMREPGSAQPGYGPGYGYGTNPYAPQNFWDPHR